MPLEAISQREAARRGGVSESTIRHHIASGSLASAVLADGRLDAAKVARLLPRFVTKGNTAPSALAAARTRKVRAQVVALTQEVGDMQARFIPVAEADRIVRPVLDRLAGRLRHLTEAAVDMTASVLPPRKALPADTIHDMLRDRIHAALTAISSAAVAEGNNEAWWDEPIKREVDLATLSETDLLARQISLQATKLEIETMHKAGTVIPVRDVVTAFGERLATAKSVLKAIPARVAEKLSVATPAEARALMAAEVGGVLRELGVPS